MMDQHLGGSTGFDLLIQTKDPSISLSIGISTLSLKPHKIGIKAINVIIALITCKPNDSIILANLLQSS